MLAKSEAEAVAAVEALSSGGLLTHGSKLAGGRRQSPSAGMLWSKEKASSSLLAGGIALEGG